MVKVLKHKVERVKSHKHYDKVVNWTKLLSLTGGTQLVVQVLGFLTGVLLVRLIPEKEYAFYTIVNTMLGTMTILADGGVGTGVIAYGGKVWQDKYKLGQVLATGISLRKVFSVISLAVTLPILAYLLYVQKALWWQIVIMIAALIPAFLAAVSDSILEIVPKLQQDLKPLQVNQLVVTLGRFVLSVAGVFFFPFTFVALLANGIPRMYGNIQLRKISSKFVDTEAKADPEVRKSILAVVKRRMPEAIYYSFSGQITIWLLSLMGSTSSVAQIGALSRISLITTSFTMVLGMLVIPRFARLPENKSVLIKKYAQGFCMTFGALLLMLCVLWVSSDLVLMAFGKEYQGLNNELVLYFIGAAIAILANFTYGLFSSRGWLMNPVFSICINAVSLGICAYFIPVTSLQGAINFGIANSLIQFVVNTFFMIYSILKKK